MRPVKLLRCVVGAGSLLLFSACAELQPFQIQMSQANMNLLEEYRVIHNWSPAQVEYVLSVRERAYVSEPTQGNGLRLALVLGFADRSEVDRQRALELFEQIAREDNTTPTTSTALASLFADVLSERAGRAETAEQIVAYKQEIIKERKRADEFERKLNALTSIEKSLRHR